MPGGGILGDMDLANVLDLDDPRIFYINHDSFNDTWWLPNSGTINVDFLHSLTRYQLVIIDLSSEHWGDPANNLVVSVQEKLESVGVKDFLIITHLIDDHLRTPNIVFCPSEYHTSRKFIRPSEIDFVKEKSYLLSCLNRNPHTHRIYNHVTMMDKTWFPKIFYHFSNIGTPLPRSDAVVLSKETWDRWQQVKPTDSWLGKSHWDMDNPTFKDSYANLVTETSVAPGVYISEKTWKPIARGMWFFILGCPGIIDHLRNLGVDVFDDLFDHDHYDREPNFYKRVDKLHEVLDDYMSMDHVSLWNKTVDRRRDNYHKFYAGDFDPGYRRLIENHIAVSIGK